MANSNQSSGVEISKLLIGDKFLYGGIRYSVQGTWHSGGVVSRYDIMSQRGKVQSQSHEAMMKHVQSGAITFI